jgi:aryl-alcohol dehydrogenase-like predicted oxidoreductase
MQYRPLGTTDLNASVVGLGTWAHGGFEWGETDDSAAIKAIHAALDAGINLVDTAPVYGFGRSEEIVGRALEGRRDKVILATKCGLRWDTDQGQVHFDDGEGTCVRRYLAGPAIRYEVEQSLKRLKTDYLDLYQTHWQDNTTAIAETMETLLELKKEGKIRAIGVSNVSVAQLEEYLAVGPLDVAQEQFSMLDQQHVDELFATCHKRGVSVLAYSPLAMGLLTGKIGPEREFPESDVRSWSPRFSVEMRTRVAELLRQLQPLADKYDLTLAQLVINWSTASTAKGVTHVLCGARTVAQAEANAKGGDAFLTAAEVAEIDAKIEDAGLKVPPVFG